MSQMNEGPTRGFVSTNDLSAKQYFIVKRGSAANDVILADAATDALVGILMNKPTAAQNATVRLLNAQGTCKVKLGGTVAVGAWLTTDSAGKAISTTTDGDEIVGKALEAGVSGDIIEIVLAHGRLYIA